jgi:hypothetical protein
MSLISDALKKARQEAARQDALRQGVPYAMGAADAPARRAPWLSLLAGLGAGCLLAGIVFVFAYIAGWGPFRKVETRVAQTPAAAAPVQPVPAPSVAQPAPPPETPAAKPQEAPPAAVTVTPPAPKPEPPRRDPEPAPVQEPPARRPAPEPAAPAPIPTSEAEPLVPAPAPVTPAAPASQPSAPAPAPSGGLEEGKVYPGEVPVPGGGSLKLNGIAYSPDHPIAVLGGRVIGPGESVQGFTVVEILADRVKLQGHGATVFLSTK